LIIGIWEKLLFAIDSNSAPIILGLIIGLLIILIFCLVLCLRLVRLKNRYNRLMGGKDQLNLEELFAHLNLLISAEQQKYHGLSSRLDVIEALVSRFVGIGLVRYNAFQDTGSDLSFSLALINHAGDGAVVTSIFGREENRLYGKPVENGSSKHPLSREEQAALEIAGASLHGRGPGLSKGLV